jgi:feruloyl-CoA synthase
VVKPLVHTTFASPRVVGEETGDGRILLRSLDPLAPHAVPVVYDFRANAAAHPERLLIAEPDGDGGWRRFTWGEVRRAGRPAGAGVAQPWARGCSTTGSPNHGLADCPVMIFSGNSSLSPE